MTGQIERADYGNFADKHYRLPGENYFESMTPLFRYENVVNHAKSRAAGRVVTELKEVVQFKFAGDKNYSPVFPVGAVYRTVDGRPVTFAERWSDQYRQFLAGDDQLAAGTPLEELKPYGITPAQLSICRALGIHSIEALHQVEGQNRKRLGAHGNELKPMAQRWMDARATAMSAGNRDDIEALYARIAELEAVNKADAAEGADDEAEEVEQFADLSDDQIKERIADKVGQRPRGNPSRSTLISMLRDLETETA